MRLTLAHKQISTFPCSNPLTQCSNWPTLQCGLWNSCGLVEELLNNLSVELGKDRRAKYSRSQRTEFCF